MSWLKLGEEFTKECAQADLSDAAFRTHVEGLAYAMDRENDGRFSDRDVRRFAETDNYGGSVEELVGAGFWTRNRTGELQIVHHVEEQPSAAYLRDQRMNAATRQRRKRELDALKAQGHSEEEAERILQQRGFPVPKSAARSKKSQGESPRDKTRDVTRDETRDPERSGTGRNGPEQSRASLDDRLTTDYWENGFPQCRDEECSAQLRHNSQIQTGYCPQHFGAQLMTEGNR